MQRGLHDTFCDNLYHRFHTPIGYAAAMEHHDKLLVVFAILKEFHVHNLPKNGYIIPAIAAAIMGLPTMVNTHFTIQVFLGI